MKDIKKIDPKKGITPNKAQRRPGVPKPSMPIKKFSLARGK